jgi:molybdopterin-biosynthesis enzyme MoeA-like protein
MDPRELPIWQLHFDLLRTLRDGNRLVLVAATGSGKTTQVPQMLLDAGIAGEKRIVVLQPRRVAARTVSARVAWERRVKLGGEVGYQIRFEDRTSLGTRICFVTEGILLRWLQDDPELRDIGVLIFDEFHERNLLSDVALALAKRLQNTTRPDLKLVVMSATMEAEPVARYLAASPGTAAGGNPPAAPILVSEGRTYPVTINWADYGERRPPAELAAQAVERIVGSGERGDILVFMPGMGEISATLNALRAAHTHVFTSGGIGPTHDDITADAIAAAFGVPITHRADAMALLAAHYERAGLPFNDARQRMARVPDGASLIDNPISTAPGFTLGNVHVMAGVPSIFEAMLAGVLPTLTGGAPLLSQSLRVNRGEGEIAADFGALAAEYPDLSMGSYPFNTNGVYGTNLVIRGTDPARIDAAMTRLAALFG